VVEDVLRSYATSYASWSEFLPMVEFALNNSVHASTGLTPFYVNNARHPRVPASLAVAMPTAARDPKSGGVEGNFRFKWLRFKWLRFKWRPKHQRADSSFRSD
jgi:hypothetical protein